MGYDPFDASSRNRTPYDLSLLSVVELSEDLAVGTGIAQLGASDPDPYSSLTYTLATGEGDSGNAKVMLTEGGKFFLASPLDYESASVLPVRIRVADEHGAYGERAFSLSVVDVLED